MVTGRCSRAEGHLPQLHMWKSETYGSDATNMADRLLHDHKHDHRTSGLLREELIKQEKAAPSYFGP